MNIINRAKDVLFGGGSLSLVVTGEDSRSRGCRFESQHWILDGHFSHLFVEKLLCMFGKTKNKRKRGRASHGPFLTISVGLSIEFLTHY